MRDIATGTKDYLHTSSRCPLVGSTAASYGNQSVTRNVGHTIDTQPLKHRHGTGTKGDAKDTDKARRDYNEAASHTSEYVRHGSPPRLGGGGSEVYTGENPNQT